VACRQLDGAGARRVAASEDDSRAASYALLDLRASLRETVSMRRPWVGSGSGRMIPSDYADYADFAYVAFTIGMTFQVSDTEISKRPIRRAAIHHALLSYLFGTMILGIAISSIAALLGR
jgi:uncharacterized protein DUF1345